MGIRNKWSIAYGIAKSAYENGAKLIFTYTDEENKSKTEALISEFEGSKAYVLKDASIDELVKETFTKIKAENGKVDGIVLTGGLLRFPEIEEKIRESCGWIAPVTSYPGEFEQEAMAFGALRVLRGEEEAKIYPGKPVWDGFKD